MNYVLKIKKIKLNEESISKAWKKYSLTQVLQNNQEQEDLFGSRQATIYHLNLLYLFLGKNIRLVQPYKFSSFSGTVNISSFIWSLQVVFKKSEIKLWQGCIFFLLVCPN